MREQCRRKWIWQTGNLWRSFFSITIGKCHAHFYSHCCLVCTEEHNLKSCLICQFMMIRLLNCTSKCLWCSSHWSLVVYDTTNMNAVHIDSSRGLHSAIRRFEKLSAYVDMYMHLAVWLFEILLFMCVWKLFYHWSLELLVSRISPRSINM